MPDLPRIVIVGAGFGGAFTARYLSRLYRGKIEIELINNNNYFIFQPLLPEVASGVVNAQDAVTPLRAMLPKVRHRQAEVKQIDFDHKRVHVLQGRRRRMIKISYDHLVLAVGQRVDLSLFPGLAEHSLSMKTLADAFSLRNRILQCLEFADVTGNPKLKRLFLSFVVVGGGFSGVETLGELQDMIRRALRYYPNIKLSEVRCTLLQRGDRILPELPSSLADYACRKLSKRGVEILLNTSLHGATGAYVETGDGRIIPTATIIATIGNGPIPLLVEHPRLHLERGKVPVNRCLQVEHLDSVWAVGDAALIPMHNDGEEPVYAPPTAQFAIREAHRLAHNIMAVLNDRPVQAFQYKSQGMLASLGAYQGAADIFGIRISGVSAWAVWRGFYMLKLPGFATQLRVALNWIFDYFIPRTIVEIEQPERPAVRFANFRKGDRLFDRGELLDGFYLVLDGQLEVRTPDPGGGKDFVKIVAPQQHLGDRIVSYNTVCRGRVTALQNTEVMIINQQDFVRLRKSFHLLDNYLREQTGKKYPSHFYGHIEGMESDDGTATPQ